jgi:DNA polymerase-3 subunit epsilon
MGRCLSPCLGDLDPNLYRERLDEALALFEVDGGAALLAHVDNQMRAAAAVQRYERAAWLRRRARRLESLLRRLGGVQRAVHAGARLVLAPHPVAPDRADAFWIVGGRIADWGPLPADPAEVAARTESALGHTPGAGAWLPADELDETRIVGLWLAGHEQTPVLELDREPGQAALAAFTSRTTAARPTRAPRAAPAARARAPAPGS